MRFLPSIALHDTPAEQIRIRFSRPLAFQYWYIIIYQYGNRTCLIPRDQIGKGTPCAFQIAPNPQRAGTPASQPHSNEKTLRQTLLPVRKGQKALAFVLVYWPKPGRKPPHEAHPAGAAPGSSSLGKTVSRGSEIAGRSFQRKLEQDSSAHSKEAVGLGRLARYLERRWDFQGMVDRVHDARQDPDIPTSSIFLSVFGMHAVRLGSLNGLDLELKIPKRWDPWVGPIKPSADTVAYALERCDPEPLRMILADAARLAKRKKVFERLYPDAYWVGALDGIETYKSKKGCCATCCQRNVGTEREPIIEFYHREVALQLVGVTPACILDEEPVLPGETEAAAGVRLLERFHKRMPRFLDVVTLDGFYLQAPFAQKVLALNYGLVIVLKQENRDLYQDAEGLFQVMEPKKVTLGVDGTAQVWDASGFTSWTQLGRPVRVVRELKDYLKRERVAKKWVERQVLEDWRWAVIFPNGKQPPTDLIRRWGHARWDEETRGFGELTQQWHFDHCYHHHPTAMLACRLILYLAFFLTTIFFQRNLKPALREGKTRLHLAGLLADDLIRGGWQSFWAQPP